MRNRMTFAGAVLALALAVYYIASPLLAAHKLREAVKSGDAATIEAMVDWQSLRASVKKTVAHNANLLPVATEVARNVSPTWWQRVRSIFGYSMLDRFIERYITPQGLPRLYRAKSRWHERFKRQKPLLVQASIIPRDVVRAWRRIKRAEFTSPIRFVLEMEDRHKATRRIKSTFQLTNMSLHGFDWKLIAVSIRNIDPTARARLARLNGF